MNAQDVFDRVATHLFTQGKRSIGLIADPYDGGKEHTMCAYRSDGGSCAVGCLIPDEDYHPRIEGYLVGELLDRDHPAYMHSLFFLEPHARLLTDLQATHDQSWLWDNTRAMREELAFVASKHGLNPAILDRLSFVDR